ncbi:MAG: hypothetical protein ACXU96_15040 [Gemmatimonadaceae bacterium]
MRDHSYLDLDLVERSMFGFDSSDRRDRMPLGDIGRMPAPRHASSNTIWSIVSVMSPYKLNIANTRAWLTRWFSGGIEAKNPPIGRLTSERVLS